MLAIGLDDRDEKWKIALLLNSSRPRCPGRSNTFIFMDEEKDKYEAIIAKI